MLKQQPKPAALAARFAEHDALCQKVGGTLALFSNPIRFKILCMLSEGEFCVNDVVDAVARGKASNVSQQLRLLSLAGTIGSRREGRQILYRLKEARVKKLIAFLKRTYEAGEIE